MNIECICYKLFVNYFLNFKNKSSNQVFFNGEKSLKESK